MAREIVDYVALALIRNRDDSASYFGEPGEFAGDMDQLKKRAEELCGFPISGTILSRALRTLADCGLVRITDDEFSGTFVKIKSTQLDDFFQRAASDFTKADQDYGDETAVVLQPRDFPAANALMNHELFEDYRELGPEWLSRALDGLRRRIGEEGSLDDLINADRRVGLAEAPASDRIVSLNHNQQSSLEGASSQLIDLVEDENSIDGDTQLRQRIVGELKAGRELIRAQSVRAFLLYQTLVTTLGTLIEKYAGAAIGIAATKLLELLIEHIFGK